MSDFLSRIVCAKNTWKSSATATEEIPKWKLWFFYKKQQNIISVKSKKLDRICLVEKLKSFMAATKYFYLTTASSNER